MLRGDDVRRLFIKPNPPREGERVLGGAGPSHHLMVQHVMT
jgi:hypothetical protein